MHPTNISPYRKLLAWSVHLFTASGLVTGFLALLAISDHRWQTAALWLLASFIIDGVDGTLARWAQVETILPDINGKTIDYVIDFATYAIIPIYFFYEAGLVAPVWLLPSVIVMLLVSALYYGKEGMVSGDLYFVGFPMLWNVAVFYMFFIFQWPSWANLILITALALLHFVPIKFTYPSRTVRFRVLNLVASLILFASLLAAILRYPDRPAWLYWPAVIAAAYFMGMAVYNTWLAPTTQSTDHSLPQT